MGYALMTDEQRWSAAVRDFLQTPDRKEFTPEMLANEVNTKTGLAVPTQAYHDLLQKFEGETCEPDDNRKDQIDYFVVMSGRSEDGSGRMVWWVSFINNPKNDG